jgi:class 3 adenylate cyclase
MRFSLARDFAAAGRLIREIHTIVRTTAVVGDTVLGDGFTCIFRLLDRRSRAYPSASHALRHAVNYPNSSMIGLPVVIGVDRPVLFCGSLSGMSSAW